MAVERRAISAAEFRKATAPVAGLQVSKPWLGYANALFLELGKLHFEALPCLKSTKRLKLKTKSLRGQAGVMIDSGWRVERNGRFWFGRDSEEALIRRSLKELKGLAVRNVAVSGCEPELLLVLSGGLHIHSFAMHRSPCWAVFLGDPELFPRDRRWFAFDHSLSVTYDEERSRLEKHMCY